MPELQKGSHPNTPSFETVWAGFQEIREIQKETALQMKETDRKMKETSLQMQETDRKMKETSLQMQETDRKMKETALQMQETDRKIKLLTEQMGGLHNSFGEVAEHLVTPGIVEKFNSLGYHFDGVADRGFKIFDEKGKLKTEIDILLENGDYIVAVEVKADVRKKDLDHHTKRLEILREYRDKKKDLRKIRGAIAGAVFHHGIKEMAITKGFYVLEQSGDTMKMDILKGFKPKEW